MPCYHRTIKCLQDSCYSNTGLHINMTNEVKCGGFYAPAAFEHLILAILVHYTLLVYRASKQGKKSYTYLTTFFMST